MVNPTDVLAAVERVRAALANRDAADKDLSVLREALDIAERRRDSATREFNEARNKLVATALGPDWLIP